MHLNPNPDPDPDPNFDTNPSLRPDGDTDPTPNPDASPVYASHKEPRRDQKAIPSRRSTVHPTMCGHRIRGLSQISCVDECIWYIWHLLSQSGHPSSRSLPPHNTYSRRFRPYQKGWATPFGRPQDRIKLHPLAPETRVG